MSGHHKSPRMQPDLELSFRLAETMLAYARRVLESQLDAAQSLVAESAATGRVLAADTEQAKASGALLAQLAQANAQHWSQCARRVAEATVSAQAQCLKMLSEHARLDGHPATDDDANRSPGDAGRHLLQPIQAMMELLATATQPWITLAMQNPRQPAAAAEKPKR